MKTNRDTNVWKNLNANDADGYVPAVKRQWIYRGCIVSLRDNPTVGESGEIYYHADAVFAHNVGHVPEVVKLSEITPSEPIEAVADVTADGLLQELSTSVGVIPEGRIRAGDILVVRSTRPLTRHQLNNFRAHVEAACGLGIKLLVLESDCEVHAILKKEGE